MRNEGVTNTTPAPMCRNVGSCTDHYRILCIRRKKHTRGRLIRPTDMRRSPRLHWATRGILDLSDTTREAAQFGRSRVIPDAFE